LSPLARRLTLAGLGSCVAVLALTSCSDEVAVDPPTPPSNVASICLRLSRELPDQVHGQPGRTTRPSSDLTAAWGSPAIVLRCGVDQPAAYQPTSQLVTVNGVNWFPKELDTGYVFTTWGREANVEVTVPDEYAPEVNPLVDLAQAVKRSDPTS